MGSSRNNLIVLGLVVVLIGVAAYFIFVRQPVAEATRLGLDLEGGVSASLRGFQEDGSEVTREEMEQAAQVIRQRVDSLGVTEPEIQLQGQDQVVVNIPGITDSDRAVELIGRTAQLGFYEVLAVAGGETVPAEEVDGVKEDLRAELEGDPAYEEGETKVLFEETPAPEGEGTLVFGYVVPEEPAVRGDALDSATQARDPSGFLEVQMTFTREGGDQFGDLSQQIVDNALANGTPGQGQLAVVLDDDVVSAPRIDQAIYGGQVSINNTGAGGLPPAEAEELEIVLQTGALPVNMEVLSVTAIGPTLGADSLRSGLIAALVGFGLVLVFLVIVYRVLGLVADLALLIYVFLLWGLIVAIPITMTLPGIAGIVLSIGVAADANVVIFERIKEEIRRGKSPRTAVTLGYGRGFKAILDGNLTTLITAFILFALSSGSVRGFAVLLAVGVVLSMFTAIAVTRALLGVISGRGFGLTAGMVGVSKGSIAATSARDAEREEAR
ncbi:protein translocase subunit SecD [Rubrobacter marinus]|uniref:Protein translocase subunit SecD n=1 Tax=Rubrobacter marinus TaxID=2653852 RepID=A0A6G8PXT5_9ACTN|nr:protein translocase subunit SecD [Rubrobacter marinus]QIN79000.1 protein translocase subunit SecD [Rubrobacter marinus]